MTLELKVGTLTAALFGLALLTGASVPATAADWNKGSGSIKDIRGSAAVPVPAPMPIPVSSPNFYFRFDAAIGVVDSVDASERGLTFGVLDSPGDTGPQPFGTRSSWLNSDFDTFTSIGAGVGYNWSDRFRTDVTLEVRSKADVSINGTERYVEHGVDPFYVDGYGPSPHDGTGVGTSQVNIYARDLTKLRSVFSLVNAYYDLGKSHGFSPYIGGGIGVAYHELTRNHSTRETTCDLTSVPVCNAEFQRTQYTAVDKKNAFSLAAALTAGVSYSVSEITTLDFNYRYLYIDGTDIATSITDPRTNHTSISKVSIGDTSEHQLRAGLRFNIH